MKRGRLCVSAAVVLASAWGAASGGTTTRPVTDAEIAKAVEPFLRTEWGGVYLLGKKIGWTKTVFSKAPDGRAYTLSTTLLARLSMLGVEQVMRIEETRTYGGPKWRLKRIDFTHAVGNRMSRASGRVTEQGLEFTRVTAGQKHTRRLPLPAESLTDAVRAQLMVVDPTTPLGTTTALRQFDPMLAKEYHCTATLVERETRRLEGVDTTVLTVRTHIREMNITSVSRLTSDGRTLETTVGLMFTVRREPEAVAKQMGVAVDPLAAAAIRLKRELPDVTRLSELVLLVRGLDEARFRIRSDRQVFDETDSPGEYRLTLKRGRWPTKAVVPGPDDAHRFKATLAATPFIQSDHPDIVALAKRIVGEETDARRRVNRLADWVFENLKKDYSAALSSALDVLQTRSGDCSEHTILFVALCRAAGIPAEEVAGVVYGRGFGGFLYHAWARVYVGEWVEVDPTFNETTVNASHIVFVVGPLESQVAVVNLIGGVKLRYVSSR